jgi:N-acetylglucosamine-6-phosphate deacetylase
MSAFAITGARIFDGDRWLESHVVVVEDGRVRRVSEADKLPTDIPQRQVEGTLAPGFIDVQVNGGGGALFNDTPMVETVRRIGAAHRKFGTTGFLPTLITDTREKMAAAVASVRHGFAAEIPGLLGVHLEGPFLNPERKGVHDPKYMRPVSAEDLRILTSLGGGRTLVTLAPEMVPMPVISDLAEAGLILSAGHTAASFEVLEEAHRLGLRGYTHVFNAMPPLMGREPGPVGAALSQPHAFISLIADLHHVSRASLLVAIAAKPIGRVMLVTDAMSVTGTDMPSFELQGRTIYRRDGRLVTPEGTLGGSDLDMATAVRNVHRELGIDLATALNMASRTPAAFLRLDNELGRIAPGYRANLVLLDDELVVRSTWIEGVENA